MCPAARHPRHALHVGLTETRCSVAPAHSRKQWYARSVNCHIKYTSVSFCKAYYNDLIDLGGMLGDLQSLLSVSHIGAVDGVVTDPRTRSPVVFRSSPSGLSMRDAELRKSCKVSLLHVSILFDQTQSLRSKKCYAGRYCQFPNTYGVVSFRQCERFSSLFGCVSELSLLIIISYNQLLPSNFDCWHRSLVREKYIYSKRSAKNCLRL